MVFNFSNYTMKRVDDLNSMNKFKNCLKGFVDEEDKDYPESTGEVNQYIEDEYSKINVISFKESFSKLQKNYKYDK